MTGSDEVIHDMRVGGDLSDELIGRLLFPHIRNEGKEDVEEKNALAQRWPSSYETHLHRLTGLRCSSRSSSWQQSRQI